jgi:carbon monoxide dehydrogenase subunit G
VIDTGHTLLIDAPIDTVWQYVQDMRRWANLLPGCKECIVEDADNSRWILKVGAGGLVRTVNALVHVDQWSGPGRVDFTYKLEGDPVEGNGSYIAAEISPSQTEVTLNVTVKGSGSLAPMWEAMSKPLLPHIAKAFATKLKEEIEAAGGGQQSAGEADNIEHPTVAQKLRNILKSRSKD